MKSRLIKFVVPLLTLLILVGATVGVVNKISAAHAASSSCSWAKLQDTYVLTADFGNVIESQMYLSTCSGAVYCRMTNHSYSKTFADTTAATVGVSGNSKYTNDSPEETLAPRKYINGPQLNRYTRYQCAIFIPDGAKLLNDATPIIAV